MSSKDYNHKGKQSIDDKHQEPRVQYASTKEFAGSKRSSFYGENYFLNGQGSNYGLRDKDGTQLFVPYEEQYYLPRDRAMATYFTQIYKPKTAVVLGCARAYLVKAFRELKIDCKGIDISEWAIKHAPTDLKEHLYVGDICDLSLFESDYFDVTVATDIFEHIAVPDLFTALNEAARITRNALIVNVPVSEDDLHPDQSSGSDKSHVSVYSIAWWCDQFRARKFRLDGQRVDTNSDGSMSTMLVFRKRSILHEWQDKPHISATITEKRPVDIIMLNWNGLKFTPKCIETLYKNTDYPFNLIVIDNQSMDGSKEYLNSAQQSYPNMHVIFSEQISTGFANGVNIGLQYCKDLPDKELAPYILLLNNDTLFLQKDWLSVMVNTLENDLDAGIVSPQLLYPDGRLQYAGATFDSQLQPYHIGRFKKPTAKYLKLRAVPWATFACVLIRRELLNQGLDEQYLLGTFEDTDFCTKARFNGFKVLYCPQASVYHYEGATVFGMNAERFSKQQLANAELFMRRWSDWLHLNRGAYPELYAE